eukprot:TRINITY_DN5791_c0_g3_i1.p1 TRINITY_DN5791_c0_g3~~TRINITY_DN5791_c0_g3_i1.p1  ORF type:complete len:186 (-),score=22.92 TRINITY_DN5791_c0_g3_i1:402-959(-)
MNAGLVGLCLMLATTITDDFYWLVNAYTILESNMNSVERILRLTNTEPEAPLIIPDKRPPKHWPSQGQIDFNGVSMRYRSNLAPVLNKITFSISPQQKIGIVGRTGAGKSSLTNVLFRLVEPSEGTITIDGLDISTIGLRDLRTKIAIIPQDPILFSGTLRYNLDPFDNYSDAMIWTALERMEKI